MHWESLWKDDLSGKLLLLKERASRDLEYYESGDVLLSYEEKEKNRLITLVNAIKTVFECLEGVRKKEVKDDAKNTNAQD